MRTRPWMGIRQPRRDLRRQPGQVGDLAQQAHPACDTTPRPSALTTTRGRTALLFTWKVPSRWESWTVEKSPYPLQDRHFSLTQRRVTQGFAQNLS
jgi:hypothetical protein